MSHFTVMVIGYNPECRLAPFDENLEVEEYDNGAVSEDEKQQMIACCNKERKTKYKNFERCYERFGEDWNGNRWRKDNDGIWREYTSRNPNSKWDWYVLGGRWSGTFLILKEGATSGIVGTSGTGGNEVGYDAALKMDIDFDAIKSKGREYGLNQYREVAQKCGGRIPKPKILWDTLLHSDKYAHYSIKQKRQIYHSQKAIKCWEAAGFGNSFFGLEIEDFQCTEEEYAARKELESFVPYAVVYDGEWFGRGDMGWWGVSSNECPADEWNAKVWEIVDSLPDDTLISFYDCHI